jgi:hypothetical protein
MEASKIAKLSVSLSNSSILDVTDEDLLRIQHEVIKGSCEEAIAWNLKSGARVCQARSALRGDLVYDVSYRQGVSIDEQGKLTADLAAALKAKTDQGQAKQVIGHGLIYGMQLMPAGILPNTPDAKPVDCPMSRL